MVAKWVWVRIWFGMGKGAPLFQMRSGWRCIRDALLRHATVWHPATIRHAPVWHPATIRHAPMWYPAHL